MRRYPYLVYSDSADPNSAAQLAKWFRYGFLRPDSTLVVARFYYGAVVDQIRQLEAEGISYLFFWPFDVVDLSQARIVLYPYHTNTNQILIKRRGPVHVFIGHGDSDKAGSVNPLIRIYDHVFVSGDLTIQRLRDARVMNPYDIAEGRAIRVGMPYLAPVSDADLSPPRDGYVLYAPTWEGIDSTQCYSSLEAGYGERLVGWLLENTDLDVVFRPHPSTGRKSPEFSALVTALCKKHQRHRRFHLQWDVGAVSPSPDWRDYANKWTGQRTPSESIAGARWVITDVSSMLSSALYMARPAVVIRKSASAVVDGRADVLSERSARVLEFPTLPDNTWSRMLTDNEAYDDAVRRTVEARAQAVSLEPYLMNLQREQHLDAIAEALSRSSFRRRQW